MATLKTSLCNPVPLPLTLIPCSRLLPSSPSCTRVHLIATPTETRIDTTHCSGNSPDFPARFRISTGHLKDHPRHLARIGPPTDWWLGQSSWRGENLFLPGSPGNFRNIHTRYSAGATINSSIMDGGTTRPKILTLLVTLIRLVGENSGRRGWLKGFFLIKVVLISGGHTGVGLSGS